MTDHAGLTPSYRCYTNTGEVTLADVVVSDALVPDCSRTLAELAARRGYQLHLCCHPRLESDYTFSNSGTRRAWADAYNTVVKANEDNNTRDIDVGWHRMGSGLPLQGSQSLPSGPQPTPTNVP